MIATYFQSWSSRWTALPEAMDLVNVTGVDVINIAFVKPDTTYKAKQLNFNGTGLDFSQDFDVVKAAIAILRQKKITVMLAVGGATFWSYSKPFNVTAVLALMTDLGCDGIDLDWEVGITDSPALTSAILSIANVSTAKISIAGWSTGCQQPSSESVYRGSAIDALTKAGSAISWVNIMAYDAGPPDQYDAKAQFNNYRIYYPGPLILGFEVGYQLYPFGYKITMGEVSLLISHVFSENINNGIFTWSWQKDAETSPTVKQINLLATQVKSAAQNAPQTPLPPPPTQPLPPPPTQTSSFNCPYCLKTILAQKSV